MGFMQRFERKLEDAVGNTFARVFGGKIVPAEVEDALHREAARGLQKLNGHALAPNQYVLTVSESDQENLTSDTELTLNAFAKHLTGYIGDQGWETYGAVSVELESSPHLHTGQFRARSVIAPDDDALPLGPDQPAGESPAPFIAPPPLPGAMQMPSESQDAPQPRYQPQAYSAGQYTGPQDPPRRAPQPDGQYQDPRYEDPRYEEPRYPEQRPPARPYDLPPAQDYPDAPSYQEPQYQRPESQRAESQYAAPQYPEGRYGEDRYGGDKYGDGRYGGDQYAQPQYAEPQYAEPQYAEPQYAEPEPPAQAYSERPQSGQSFPHQQRYSNEQYADPRFQPPAHLYPQQPPAREPASSRQPGQHPQPAYGYQDQAYVGPEYPLRDPSTDYYADEQYPAPGGAPEQQWAAPAPAVILELGDGSGRNLELRRGSNIIGRGQDAHFRIPDTGVSRQHADVQWDGAVALIVDLQSTNGTVVNDTPVNEWQLADGDVIRIGHSDITVRFH